MRWNIYSNNGKNIKKKNTQRITLWTFIIIERIKYEMTKQQIKNDQIRKLIAENGKELNFSLC